MGPTCSVLAAALLRGGWCSPFEDEFFNSKIHTVTLNVIHVECRVVSGGVQREGRGRRLRLSHTTNFPSHGLRGGEEASKRGQLWSASASTVSR